MPRARVCARERERTVSLVLRHRVLVRVEFAPVEELELGRDDLWGAQSRAISTRVLQAGVQSVESASSADPP